MHIDKVQKNLIFGNVLGKVCTFATMYYYYLLL